MSLQHSEARRDWLREHRQVGPTHKIGGFRWSEEEDRILHKYMKDLPTAVANLPGRTLGACDDRRYKLGLLPKKRLWTAQEVKILRENAHAMSLEKLTKLFVGRNKMQVSVKATKLGLHRKRNPPIVTKKWLLDEIRKRYLALGYNAKQMDEFAGTGIFYYKQRWKQGVAYGHSTNSSTHPAYLAALDALGGKMKVEWPD